MGQPLDGKYILVVEDDAVFRCILSGYLQTLGATVGEATNGAIALSLIHQRRPDVMLCDLFMPEMNGIALMEQLQSEGYQIPTLVISATEDITDVAKVMRLGVQDVLLKPIDDLTRLRDSILTCLYPQMFTSQAIEEVEFLQDWQSLCHSPEQAVMLLKQLQPPINQNLAHYRINYRQLTSVEEIGLVFDIAALSERELGFYCLDVTRAGNNGVLAALLLRALFNSILQEHLAGQEHRLPQMPTILRKVNQLFRQANLEGQFPILAGYYQTQQKHLLLVSAGLHANLITEKQQIRLNNGVPLGTLDSLHVNQISQGCASFQCQVWGNGGKLRLMLSPETHHLVAID